MAETRHWFARAGHRLYPDAYAPVTTEGRIVYGVVMVGMGIDIVALVVIGQVYREPIWAAFATSAILAITIGAHTAVSRWKGDPEHTLKDYTSGRVGRSRGGVRG